jgi:hypothetical protein
MYIMQWLLTVSKQNKKFAIYVVLQNAPLNAGFAHRVYSNDLYYTGPLFYLTHSVVTSCRLVYRTNRSRVSHTTTHAVKERRDVIIDMGQIKYCPYVIERTACKSTFFKNIVLPLFLGIFKTTVFSDVTPR